MSGRLRTLPTLLACALAGSAMATPVPVAPAAPASPPRTADAPAPAVAPPIDPTLAGSARPDAGITPSPAGPATPASAAPVVAVSDAPTAIEAPAAPVAFELPVPARAEPPPLSFTRGDEVFARIRRNLGGTVCAAGGNSEKWRRRYAANPAMFANRLEQILPLLDFVSTEVERVGLPSEFVFIPLVESWYKPDAMGAGGPAGMWQMIGTTAKNHGIHIQPGYDGRLSPVESTRAALSYLRTLHGMFGNWQATVMAYNAGEGRILQAFKRARSRDTSGDRRRPHGLSNITYDYVSKLQALSCLVSQPERHALKLPRASRFVPLAPVLMAPGVASIEQFAGERGRSAAELRRLNPGFKAGRVVAGVPRLLLMPVGGPQAGATRTDAIPPAAVAAAGAARVAAPAPADAVELAATPEAALLAVSGPAPAELLAADAPASADAVAEPEAGPAAAMAPAVHHVVAGESLWSIAHLYQLSIEDLRALNRMQRRDVVHAGDTLKLSP